MTPRQEPARHARRLRITARARYAPRVGLAALLALSLGCGEPPGPAPELPALPGVADDDGSWFWRDVLSAPLPGEAPPRLDVLARSVPAEVVDGLAELAETSDPATLTTLMTALRDERVGVACVAARGLGVCGLRAAIPRLIKSLGPYPVDYDVPLEVRAAAASALARLGNPAGVPLILAVLAEGTDAELDRALLPWVETTSMVFVQELAIEGLPALAGTDFGFDPNAPVPARETAAIAARAWWDEQRVALWAATEPLEGDGLVTRARLLVRHLRAYQLRQIDGARFTLANLGPGVLTFLREGLASSDDYQHLHVLQVMETLARDCDRKTRGRLAAVAAVPLLEHASVVVAAQAAAVCGAAAIPDPLVNALEQRREPSLLLAVVDALGATRRPDMLAVLETWAAAQAGAPTPDLAAALEAARLQLDPERPPDGLLALLSSSDPDVVFPAVERLIRITGSDQGLEPLAAPAAREPALAAARSALERRPRPADG